MYRDDDDDSDASCDAGTAEAEVAPQPRTTAVPDEKADRVYRCRPLPREGRARVDKPPETEELGCVCEADASVTSAAGWRPGSWAGGAAVGRLLWADVALLVEAAEIREVPGLCSGEKKG